MAFKHPIPQNVSEARNLLGITTSRNIAEAAVILFLWFFINKYFLFYFTLLTRAIIFIFALFPTLIAFVGVGEKSMFQYFSDLITFKLRHGVYKYRLPVPIVLEEENSLRKNKEKPAKENKPKKEKSKKRKENKKSWRES